MFFSELLETVGLKFIANINLYCYFLFPTFHKLLKSVFNSFEFYLYSAFYNKIVPRSFTESETQSVNPQVSTVAKKNSLLTGRNLEQDPAYKEEPCKYKNERETGQREESEGETEKSR